jgi:hypothetical protein
MSRSCHYTRQVVCGVIRIKKMSIESDFEHFIEWIQVSRRICNEPQGQVAGILTYRETVHGRSAFGVLLLCDSFLPTSRRNLTSLLGYIPSWRVRPTLLLKNCNRRIEIVCPQIGHSCMIFNWTTFVLSN